MERAVLRYRVNEADLAKHLDLLGSVYEELDRASPSDFSWATYRIDDSLDFIEIVTAPQLPGPLPDLVSFRRYRAQLEQRCISRTFDSVSEIGSYDTRLQGRHAP